MLNGGINYEMDVVSQVQPLMDAPRIVWLPRNSFISMPASKSKFRFRGLDLSRRGSWAHGTGLIFDLHLNRDRTGA